MEVGKVGTDAEGKARTNMRQTVCFFRVGEAGLVVPVTGLERCVCRADVEHLAR